MRRYFSIFLLLLFASTRGFSQKDLVSVSMGVDYGSRSNHPTPLLTPSLNARINIASSEKITFGTGLEIMTVSSGSTEEVPHYPYDVAHTQSSIYYYDNVHYRHRDYFISIPFYGTYTKNRFSISPSVGMGIKTVTTLKGIYFNNSGESRTFRFMSTKLSPKELIIPFSIALNYDLESDSKLKQFIGFKSSVSAISSSESTESSWSVGIHYGIKL